MGFPHDLLVPLNGGLTAWIRGDSRKGGCYARRMACISEMLGERRRVMMRMRVAKRRVYITSERMNRWLTSSPSAGLTIGNIGWNRGQDQADATILAELRPSGEWLTDI